jgi:signal transduction histidine kinase
MQEEKSFEDKFNALAVFFNAAAHELRTPVTTGKIYIQMLAETMKQKGDDAAVENLSKAEGQLNKLNLIITNVLDVSRMHTGKFNVSCEETEVNDAVDAAIKYKEIALAKHVIVKEGHIWDKAFVNKERVIQVVSNLLDNAAKFSKAKSNIHIELSENETSVFVKITDEGKGISEDDISKIFDEDFRKNKAEKMSGLGISLYISKAIAEKMKGSLTVESDIGKGSCFTLQLPKASPIRS